MQVGIIKVVVLNLLKDKAALTFPAEMYCPTCSDPLGQIHFLNALANPYIPSQLGESKVDVMIETRRLETRRV